MSPDIPKVEKPPDVWEAEKRKFEAEAALAEAEARKKTAEAIQEENDRRKSDIALEKVEQEYEEYRVGDEFKRVYRFTDAVASTSAKACMAKLALWMRLDEDKEKKTPIEIWFSSPGGSVIDGMALFDTIQQVRAAGHHVTTGTVGYAASMAGILLQAGNKRVMGKEAYILIHEISTGMIGKLGEIEDEVEFCHKIQKRIVQIFAERSKMSAATIARKWRRKDWWLDSDECLKYGFVDEVR